jgi:hypothetical protein
MKSYMYPLPSAQNPRLKQSQKVLIAPFPFQLFVFRSLTRQRDMVRIASVKLSSVWQIRGRMYVKVIMVAH